MSTLQPGAALSSQSLSLLTSAPPANPRPVRVTGPPGPPRGAPVIHSDDSEPAKLSQTLLGYRGWQKRCCEGILSLLPLLSAWNSAAAVFWLRLREVDHCTVLPNRPPDTQWSRTRPFTGELRVPTRSGFQLVSPSWPVSIPTASAPARAASSHTSCTLSARSMAAGPYSLCFTRSPLPGTRFRARNEARPGLARAPVPQQRATQHVRNAWLSEWPWGGKGDPSVHLGGWGALWEVLLQLGNCPVPPPETFPRLFSRCIKKRKNSRTSLLATGGCTCPSAAS